MPSSWLGHSCDKAIDKSLVRNYHFGGLSLPEISGNIYFCDFTIGDNKELLRSRLVTTCDSVESCRFWMFLGLRACSESFWTSLYDIYIYISLQILTLANAIICKSIIFLTLSPTKHCQTIPNKDSLDRTFVAKWHYDHPETWALLRSRLACMPLEGHSWCVSSGSPVGMK